MPIPIWARGMLDPNFEAIGFNWDGAVNSKNGEPFSIPGDVEQDCRNIVAVGDVIGYRFTPRKWRVSYVDENTVKMKPIP